MTHRRLAVGVAAFSLTFGAGGVAVAASASAPARTTIKEKQRMSVVINRYVQDGMRWNHDVYHVRRGGTLHIVANKLGEGPHTFTVVRKKDEPTTAKQINDCLPKGICGKLAVAHGANPQTEGPPQFMFLENGKGTNTAPNVDRPGDSAAIGFGPDNKSVDLKVTAKKGTTLRFMCLIHPWMQAKVVVG
jgi:uncharacterized cupredoxin-like copper-binding protein